MKLLTTKAVAEQLDVATVTVIRMHDAGALPAVVVKKGKGKRILRFRAETIEKFIKSHEVAGGAA